MAAYAAGQRRFGENRPLEMEAKAKALPADIEWHFIGHLQTNKIKNVIPYASLIESVDSLHLLEAIEKTIAFFTIERIIPSLKIFFEMLQHLNLRRHLRCQHKMVSQYCF